MENSAYGNYLRYIEFKRYRLFNKKLYDLFHSVERRDFAKIFKIGSNEIDTYVRKVKELLDMIDPDITWDENKKVVLKGFGAFEELDILTLLADFMDTEEDWENYMADYMEEKLVECLINNYFNEAALEKIKNICVCEKSVNSAEETKYRSRINTV